MEEQILKRSCEFFLGRLGTKKVVMEEQIFLKDHNSETTTTCTNHADLDKLY